MAGADKPDNLVEMLEESVRRFAGNRWMGTKNAHGEYEWTSYAEVGRRVDDLRAALALLGVGPGDSVAIIANNGVPWAVACYAAYGRGARFVPMYEAELESVWEYIVRDSGAKVLFVSTQAIYERTRTLCDRIPGLEHVVRIAGEGEGTMAELERRGHGAPVAAIRPQASDIAGLIYTSGTTGEPKGVLLSHGNLTHNIHALLAAYPDVDERTRTLSFLPWAHSYGQVAELHLLMRIGGSTGFAESQQTIVDDLLLVRPTMLLAVPRIFNRVYDGVRQRMAERGGPVKKLFDAGLWAARRRRELAPSGAKSWLAEAVFFAADGVVFQKVRDRFGGELQMSFSSSAALSPHVARFFFDIGLPVYEAWGMTELSPAATVNTPGRYKVGSAGKPLAGVRVSIDRTAVEADAREGEGEILVHGPNVMQGYHNKSQATAEVMTADGGLRTGDRGYLDEDGFLFITGRIKEQFKLENGKFVFPAAIEEEVKLLAEVEHAMIHGLNRPFTVCIVVPDRVALGRLATERGLASELDELVQRPEIQRFYADAISAALRGKFASYEIPKKFLVVAEPFSPENGLLTPTLKLKRRSVLEKYGPAIEALYA